MDNRPLPNFVLDSHAMPVSYRNLRCTPILLFDIAAFSLQQKLNRGFGVFYFYLSPYIFNMFQVQSRLTSVCLRNPSRSGQQKIRRPRPYFILIVQSILVLCLTYDARLLCASCHRGTRVFCARAVFLNV